MRRPIAISLVALIAACSASNDSNSSAVAPRTSSTTRISQGPVALTGAPSRPLAAPLTAEVASAGAAALQAGCASVTVAMKVLVVSGDGTEADLPAITDALAYHTIPYDSWILSAHGNALPSLYTGCAGNYQAVILTTASNVAAAMGTTNWAALQAYEAGFGVRELSWYTYPTTDRGLAAPGAGVDTATTPVAAHLTSPAGTAAFPYLKADATITIANAYLYPAQPAGATALLVDGSGNALVSTYATGGRELMSVTFDDNAALLHGLVLAHGLVDWVTKGLYLGQYRAYLTPQVDDTFIADDVWPVTGATYRMAGTDMDGLSTWLHGVQATTGSGFRIAHAFNGSGGLASETASPSSPNLSDALVASAKAHQADFLWVNHTFEHLNLGPSAPQAGDGTNLNGTQIEAQFSKNEAFGRAMGFASYRSANFVSPDVSGLTNPKALRALAHRGVRFMITDTSVAGWNNPAPNIGIQSQLAPEIYLVPRRPTNLFYDVSTPEEWVGQYNALYATQLGTQTIDQIEERESDLLVAYMLRGDLDPQMYHQANLRLHDGTHSLLSDLHDKAIQKYRAYSTLPIQSPDLDVIGARMKDAAIRNASGLTATLSPGVAITLASPKATRVALTRPGACPASGGEVYADKCIVTVNVPAGRAVTVPLQ